MQISAHNTSLGYPQIQSSLGHENSADKSSIKSAEASNNNESNVHAQTQTSTKEQNRPHELSEDEKRYVNMLQDTDREVRAHEAAHMAAAGGLARGGASYSYQTGPDGRSYAVGGEVSIDTSPVDGNPEATIQKAQTIRAAALAPAQPSSADQAVAAAASSLEASARAELAAEKREEQQNEIEDKSSQDTEEATEKSSQADLAAKNADSEVSRYQDAANPSAPSDLVGQLLNTSV